MTVALLLDPQFRTTQMWLDGLTAALPDEQVVLLSDAGSGSRPAGADAYPAGAELDLVDVVLVRGVDPGNLHRFSSLRFIQCLWAGVDRLLSDPSVPTAPLLARTVDPAMADQMAATAVGHVLDIALGHHRYRAAQARGEWKPRHCAPMSSRTVGILGFGSLGRRCADLLTPFGFRIVGLRHSGAGSVSVHSSDQSNVTVSSSMPQVLAASDIVVNLLPLTSATEGVLDRAAFETMRPGAALVNLARGRHVVDADLLAALDSGHLSRAVLDVFHDEPLPGHHPFWSHPLVTVTPHVAAETDPRSAAPILAANVRAFRRGDVDAITGLVDRTRGY